MRKNENHPNDIFIENNKNTEESAGVLVRIAAT